MGGFVVFLDKLSAPVWTRIAPLEISNGQCRPCVSLMAAIFIGDFYGINRKAWVIGYSTPKG